jgi:hypothetical protein
MRLGSHLTDAQRAVDSTVHMGNTNFLGHHHSEETKAKISATERGKILSPETRAKMFVAKMGNTSRLGIHPSEETRAKMSLSVGRGSSNARWNGGQKLSWARSAAQRRTLGFVPLNKPFVSCEGHHVDNEQVINMPKALHRSVFHRQTDGRGMPQINAIAYNFLFKQEVETAMKAMGTDALGEVVIKVREADNGNQKD